MAKTTQRIYEAGFRLAVWPMLGLILPLIFFFAATAIEEDILSVLTVYAPDEAALGRFLGDEIPSLLEIEICNPTQGGTGFLIASRSATPEQIDEKFALYAKLNKETAIIFRALPDAPHGMLIQALNLAYKNQMTNLILLGVEGD